MKDLGRLLYTVFCFATAMVGYTIHHSVFYSIVNFLFAPLAWCYWLFVHAVNLTIIKETFSFFLQ